MTTTYCHVCLGDVSTCKVAKCPNGHACCEKHHIQRVKAIYESGRKAFHGGGGQICFECRADMPDSVFSENYIKLLRITIAVEFSKQTSGRRMTNEVVAECMCHVAEYATRRDAVLQYLGLENFEVR